MILSRYYIKYDMENKEKYSENIRKRGKRPSLEGKTEKKKKKKDLIFVSICGIMAIKNGHRYIAPI